MAKGVYVSKALAIGTIAITVCAVGGIITMVIVYQMQYEANAPGPRPTFKPTTPFPTGPPPTLRLPGNVIPEAYNVYLQPYLYTEVTTNTTIQNLNFTGNCTVRLKCVETSKSIFLHSKDLKVTKVTVQVANGGKDIVENYELHDDDTNFFEIRVKDVLWRNETYELYTEFEGKLKDDLFGIYLSEYEDRNGKDRFLMASQMQPTDARGVFPCFDEPALKAQFTITMIHRPGTTALSNGRPDASNVDINGEEWTVTKFTPTKNMSTYLLAFIVSDFSSIQTSSNNKQIQVWARPEAIEYGHADYASNITGKILAYYEDLFTVNYPLSKLDQVAIPDFSAGAMENWGAVLYRETALLYEEAVSSISNKEWIATVISHELAHQWFGNLVTIKWWNDVWLSEGLATYISYFGVDAVERDWNIKDMMVLREIQTALQVDSLNTSHPLSSQESDVQTPSQIIERFDTITYSKGAAVLRMLDSYLEGNVFENGLKCYLKRFTYTNADYNDLITCLEEAASEASKDGKVEELMRSWTKEVGYPVIIINTIDGKISQEHFLLNRTTVSSTTEWQVPIWSMIKGSKTPRMDVLKTKETTKETFKVSGDEWLLANINCTGFYRVNYNPENWAKLLEQLEEDVQAISVVNRGQLIDDAFNLARAHYVNVTLALSTTKFLRNDKAYIPWDSALKNLDYFLIMFDRSEVYGPMKRYLRKQVQPLYQYYQNYTNSGTVPEALADQFNQINAISLACSMSYKPCVNMAIFLFHLWMENDTNVIHPNLKSVIYCSAIASGEEEEWNFAWAKYQSANIATEREKLGYALSCTKKIWLLNRYLEYTLDPKKIRIMDMAPTISNIARNVAGQALAWNFLQAQWSYLSEEYRGVMSLSSLIDKVTQRFSTEFEVHELQQFQRDHENTGIALERAIERTQANLQWMKENKHTVLNWFVAES